VFDHDAGCQHDIPANSLTKVQQCLRRTFLFQKLRCVLPDALTVGNRLLLLLLTLTFFSDFLCVIIYPFVLQSGMEKQFVWRFKMLINMVD